jgi:hypothetical protein
MTDGEFDNLIVNNVLTIGADTNLYRSGADVLKTDDALYVSKNIAIPEGVGAFYKAGTYIQMQHTARGGVGFISWNANLTTSGPPTGSYTNEFTPIYYGDPTASMGVLACAAGRGLLYYAVYQHGTDNSEVDFNNFTTLLQVREEGQLRLPVTGSNAGILIGGDVSLYREQYVNTLNTNASYFNVAGGIKAQELQIKVPNWDDIIIYGIAGMQTGDDPVLYLSNASLLTDNDVLVYGSIGAITDPNKTTGGGVIIIGHGWTGTSDYPAIVLTDYPSGSGYDTLWLKHSHGATSSDLAGLDWGNLACGTITSYDKLYLTGNTNGYLWNNGGYIRQSGGYGFVADGYLVVGTLSSGSSGPLYIDGNHRISYYSSSIRHKENIETTEDASWVYNLRPVNFDWKDQKRAKEEGRQLGLIAEEVNALYPQLTWLDSKGNPEGVHYEWLGVPLLVEVKKLRNRIETIENQLKQNLKAA